MRALWLSLAVMEFLAMLAGQARAITPERLDAWVTKYETVELDWKAALGNREDLKPLTIPMSSGNVTLEMTINRSLFKGNATGVPSDIVNDLLTGTVQGDPDSYVSLTVWPTGLNGQMFFSGSDGDKLVHIDKMDGTNLTVLYDDRDFKKRSSPLEKRSAPETRGSRLLRRGGLWKRQEAKATPAAGKECGLGVVADTTFVTKFGNDSVKQMASIVNDIQATYLRNFDVALPIDVAVLDTADKVVLGDNGINKVGDINLVLDQLSAASDGDAVIPVAQSRGLCSTMLFSARSFGATLGVAFVGDPAPGEDGGICTGKFATGVTTALGPDGSDLPQASWATAFAHEIGHLFGANHDEDSGCANQNNIMSALVDTTGVPVTTFSTCSLTSITAVLGSKSQCFRARA